MKIGSYTFTRDSALWIWGMVAAVISGLATVSDSFAVGTLGIPLAWLTKIRLAAFVTGLVSAKNASSSLPHSNDPQSVDLSKLER
jgi:hypothetical protein